MLSTSSLERRRCQDQLMAKGKCLGSLIMISSLTQSSPSNRFQWWERGISYWIRRYWVVLIRRRGCHFISTGIMLLGWVMCQGLSHFLEQVLWRTITNFSRILEAWRRLRSGKGSLHLLITTEHQQQLINHLKKTSLSKKNYKKRQLMPQSIP